MNIDKLISSLTSVGKNEQVGRPEAVRKTTSVHGALIDAGHNSAGVHAADAHSGVDRVEISPEARALADLQNDNDQGVPALSDQRIADIRARLSSGVYNSPEVADAIARALLDRNDL